VRIRRRGKAFFNPSIQGRCIRHTYSRSQSHALCDGNKNYRNGNSNLRRLLQHLVRLQKHAASTNHDT
jgi:hypothetical protein